MKQFYKSIIFVCFTYILLLSGFSAYADGSKDLYPNTVRGQRSFLMSSSNTTTAGWPFMQIATQYVYAKAGETVAAASSAQGIGFGVIRLTAPDGTIYSSTVGDVINGHIDNRTQELAGPNVGATTTGYTPFTQLVSATQAGIWKVELLPTRVVSSTVAISTAGVGGNANANWSGQNANSHAIRAWDISVIGTDGAALIPGRAYTTVMNMYNAGNYYSSVYVLTNDGYVYQVNNNGIQGLGFAYFVNNKGITDDSSDGAKPIYKSVPVPSGIGLTLNIKDPRSADGISSFTHKIFYTYPDSGMPASSPYFGGTTWLRAPKVVPAVSGITVNGIEGTVGQVSRKGATLKFNANMAGGYRVSLTGPAPFVARQITGSAVAGNNTVLWDGKDGAGAFAAPGSSTINVSVILQGAEVHFPFLDVEDNVLGIIIEQLNDDGSKKPGGDFVYWDDSNFPAGATASNPQINGNSGSGISSNINGHKWGNLYGDVRAMDTWTYILGDVVSQNALVTTKVADLEVPSITPSSSTVTVGGTVTFTVPVVNHGPSDVTAAPFKFKLPAGLTVANATTAATYTTACVGAAVKSAAIDASGDYTALLDLSGNNCTIVFTITATVNPAVIGNNLNVEASIMRPPDVTDPDATNPDPSVLPTDPHIECLNGTATEGCNNIKYNLVTVIPVPPVSGGDQIVCQIIPIQTLTATATAPTGYTVVWYDAAIGGNVVASPAWNSTGTRIYYAESTNGTNVSATRTAVTLTINATPVLIVTNPAPVCAGSTVDLTAPSVTLGSTAGLTYTYFTDAAATIPLTLPGQVAQTGTYYIKATSPAGCTTISPVNVFIVTVPEVTTVQPTCIFATGSITINSPLGAGIDYSIDGTNYQSATLFNNLIPGTYNVTARNQAIGCISPAKTVTINPNATTATPVLTQPDCNVATGTITFPVDAAYQYSINNGSTFVANNVFSALVPGTYTVRMKLIATSCIADAINVVIAAQPARPTTPVSGGDQVVCAATPIQTLTATATVSAGNTITWYDAATNGNVVSSPILNAIGTKIYYAETSNGTCTSLTRTPVLLAITASPVINNIADQNSCGPLTLPQITGTNLSGNQAYYTAINKGGTKYNPGDVFNTPGLTTLYAYDEIPGVVNPADLGTRLALSVNATYNTGTKLTDLLSSTDYGYVGVPSIAPNFTIWQGGAQSFLIPRAAGKTYEVFTGQTSLPNGQSITGNVFVSMEITLTPQIAAETGNTGRISIVNTATNKVLYETQLSDVARRAIITPKVEGIVSATDLQAGNISILVALKSTGSNLWVANNLIVTYRSVLPTCPATQSLKVTINAIPTAPVTGGDQVVCATNPIQTLTAAATTDAGNTITWYDAATGGNIVVAPTLNTVGTKTYYAQSSNGTCTSLTRTAVTLTINASSVAPVSGGDQIICATDPIQTLTATATVDAGNTITWYDAAIGGNIVTMPVLNAVGIRTYYAEAGNGTCTSLTRTSVTLTINASPVAPVSGGDQVICAIDPIQTLTATATTDPGNAITWYDAAIGGNIVTAPTLNIVGTKTYYAEANNSTCTSLTRTAVTLTINASPIAPVSGGDQVVCASSPVQTLTATATVGAGNTLTWYDAAIAGNIVTAPTLNTIGTKTYYAETSNGTCTSLTRTPVTLTINATPVLRVTNPAPVCAGSTVDLTAPSVTLGSTVGLSYTYFTDAATTIPLTLPGQVAQTGTYYIKATSTAGCTTISPVNVFIVTVPEVTTVLPTCIIATGSLTVNSPLGAGIDYSIDGTNYQSATLFDNLPPGTYNVTARNQAIGCISPAKTVTINPNPTTGTPTVLQPDCDLATGTITFPVDAAYQYSINNGSTFVANNVFSALAPGTYTVRMKLIATSCIADAINVVIAAQPARPTTLVSGGDQVVCAATPIQTLTATATVSAGNTLTWYDAATNGNVVSSPILNTIGTKTYYAETSNGTCTSLTRTAVTLTINATPVLIVTNPAPVCAGSTVDLTAPSVTLGSTVGLSYTYFTDAAATNPLTSPSAIAQTGTYYIKATSTAGCTTISPVNVFIVTVPEVTTVLPTCIIATGSLTVNSPLGAGIDYSIDGISYQSATLFDNLPPGTYNVTARNQAIGCISPAKTVTINPNATTGTPVVTQPDCNVATGTITFPVDASYQYSIDNGGTFAANNVFSALVPGTYIVRMKLIATSCIADAINVVIAAQPARPIAPVSGGDQVVCAATPIQTLTATATVGAGNTLTWYDAATGGNVVSNPTLNTIGTKIYYAESNNGTCTSLTRTGVTLTINANPIAIAGTPQTQSNSGVFTLGATSAIAGAIGSWSVVSGTPAVAVSDINDPNATMSLSPNTSVTLRWTVTTGSCSATDDVILTYTSSTLPSGGQVALVKTINNAGTGANGAFRQGDEIRYLFVVTNTGNLTLTNIVIKDPMISNQDISISGILAPGAPITYTANYKVTLADAAKGQVSNQAVVTTSDPNGKPVTDQSGTDLTNDVATTTVIENLSPKATNDSGSTESGKPISINVVTDDLAGSAPLDPSTIEIIDQPLHGTLTVNADGTVVYTSAKGYIGTDVFTYRVKDINGNWSNVASVTIILSKVTLTIPTLFSPNGDGVNDTFEIRGLELFTESELTIVNRWGNEVYRSSHYKNDWIGQGLNEGTYYYLLRVKANAGSEWQVFKGYTTLIRTFRK